MLCSRTSTRVASVASTMWMSAPMWAAARAASGDSSVVGSSIEIKLIPRTYYFQDLVVSSPTYANVNVVNFAVGSCSLSSCVAIPAIAELSIPPLRYTASGTSDRSRSRTDSTSRSRTVEIMSSIVAPGTTVGAGKLISQYERVSICPVARQMAKYPGGSWIHSYHINQGRKINPTF